MDLSNQLESKNIIPFAENWPKYLKTIWEKT